jgi:hypothetical protein
MLCGNQVFVAWLIHFNIMRIIPRFGHTLTSTLLGKEKDSYLFIRCHMGNCGYFKFLILLKLQYLPKMAVSCISVKPGLICKK